MMKVHSRVLRCGMKVDNIEPQVDSFAFLVSSRPDRVGFRPTSDFVLRYWPSVFRDVAFLQVPGSTGTAQRESAKLHLPPLGEALDVTTQEPADHEGLQVEDLFKGEHYLY